MALDTFDEIVGKVLLHVPSASSLLAREWVNNAFRELAEKREWSWTRTKSQFLIPALHNDGTVTVTRGSSAVVGAGTNWTSAMVGRQFRTSLTAPIYTILAVDTATSLTLDENWGDSTASGSAYEIYQAYVTAPADFLSFLSVWDPTWNWQLYLSVTQEELNWVDAQRSYRGTTYVVADLDYDGSTPPRFELWPHRTSQYFYPYIYWRRYEDLEDAGTKLPRGVRGDVLLSGALREAAAWPGPDRDTRNPFANEYRLRYYGEKFERQVAELERRDEEVFLQDLWYADTVPATHAPFPYPFLDADFLQSHAL